ncbi:hypothetical protein V2W45_1256817, partial [Cenococcum geophilum]
LLNKAYYIRNNDSLAHIAIKFIDYPFTVLYSATPLFTGIRDNFSLAALIKPQLKLNFLIRTPNGAVFKKNDNPFKVADNYLAAIL